MMLSVLCSPWWQESDLPEFGARRHRSTGIGDPSPKSPTISRYLTTELRKIRDPHLLKNPRHHYAEFETHHNLKTKILKKCRNSHASSPSSQGSEHPSRSRSVFPKARLQRANSLFLPAALHLDRVGNPARFPGSVASRPADSHTLNFQPD